MTNLRQALRFVTRQPGSAAVVIVTLAVSIGATTIIVSLVEFLLHAIPVADASRLAFVSSTDPRPSQAQSGMDGAVALSGTSVPDLVDWASRVRSIDEFIAYRYDSATLRENDVPERVRVIRTTANLPAAFGLRPTLGRVFRADEGRPGAPHVVLLSDRFWRQRFGANRDVVGTSLLLDGAPHGVTGVLPAAASRGVFVDTTSERILMTMSSSLAALATLLAAIGLYAVLAYSVSQRVREIGIRVALGARSVAVQRLILGQTLRIAGVASVVGIALAVGLGQLGRTMLFGVGAFDPRVQVGAAALMLVLAAVAGALPARRAAAVNPVEALRAE